MNQVLDMLVQQWLYDVSVLSTPWVLYTVVPALLYIIFMLVKWSALTLPVWLPLRLVLADNRKSQTIINNELPLKKSS